MFSHESTWSLQKVSFVPHTLNGLLSAEGCGVMVIYVPAISRQYNALQSIMKPKSGPMRPIQVPSKPHCWNIPVLKLRPGIKPVTPISEIGRSSH